MRSTTTDSHLALATLDRILTPALLSRCKINTLLRFRKIILVKLMPMLQEFKGISTVGQCIDIMDRFSGHLEIFLCLAIQVHSSKGSGKI
jgi:hypothetical protein